MSAVRPQLSWATQDRDGAAKGLEGPLSKTRVRRHMTSAKHQASHLERYLSAPLGRSRAGTNSLPGRIASCSKTLLVLAGIAGLLSTSPATAVAQGVCDRTPQVRDELVDFFRAPTCGDVTAEQLARLTSLNLSGDDIAILRADDFHGLSSLQVLNLRDNRLSGLPTPIFDELHSLRLLDLRDNRLALLRPGIFDEVLDTLGGSYVERFRTRQGDLYLDSDLKATVSFPSLGQRASEGETVEVEVTLSRRLPVAVRVPYSLSGSVTAEDYTDLFPALSEGLLFAAGETSEFITLKIEENDDIWEDTLVLTLGELSEIGLLRSSGEGPEAPDLKPRTLLVRSSRRDAHTISISGASPDSGLRSFCDRTQQVQDRLIEVIGVSGCGAVTAEHLANVRKLDLSQSGIEALDEHDFRGLRSLLELDLSGNELTELPEDIFRGTSSLRTLDLDYNALTGFPEGIFRDLDSLRSLDLRFNRLAGLPEGVFRGLIALQFLEMGGNLLSGLPEGLFRELESLQYLSLWNNLLTRLPEEVFRGLADLEVLWLKDNRLTRLPEGIFRGLDNLRWLNLLGNDLDSLPAGIFDGVLATLGGPYIFRGGRRQGELLLDPVLKPTLAFASTEQSAREGDTVTVAVTLSHALPLAVRVPFAVGGSATDDDFEGLRPARDFGVLFLAGETTKEIAFDLVEERDSQDKTVTLTLPELSEIPLRLSDGKAPDPKYFDARFLTAESLVERPDETATHTVTIAAPGSGPDDPRPEAAEATFIPVILSSAGQKNSYFTSELTLTNRGSEPAILDYAYTAHAGGGSGTASDALGVGEQKIVPDAMRYLRSLGIPVPDSGNRVGTLRVEISGATGVGAMVRTTTSVLDGGGSAGLAYPGIPREGGFEEAVYLCGLRQNRQDRSNVAFQNMGASGDGPITLKTTVFSGDAGADPGFTLLEEVELPPGGFHQFSGVLGDFSNGYVKVERVVGSAPFYAYGVINDQVNSDGSFVFPVTATSLEGAASQVLPVILESTAFTSELTVTNFSEEPRILRFGFVADALRTTNRATDFTLMPMRLEAGEQRILPEIVDQLRRQGVEGIGPTRGSYVGAVFATADGGDMSGIVIGARTAASDGEGGQFGVFYHAVPARGGFTESAWVDALQQNEENRSNLAVVNTGEVDNSPSVFAIDIYNGETGLLAGTVTTKPVPARHWHQINGILGRTPPGTRQGYVHIRRISGQNPFLAYGVVNDGGMRGQRSGDGAFLPARQQGPLD